MIPRPRAELYVPGAPMTIIVRPCRWGLPAVRSITVRCVRCNARCWLSVRAPAGQLRFLCMDCGVAEIQAIEADGREVDVRVAPWVDDDLDSRRR
jgi:hypothetical protein